MTTRETLPSRRANETFELFALGMDFTATVGFYDDGRAAELFLNAHKRTTDLDHAARDTSILISFALQHGATIPTLAKAMSRDADGRPQGLAGHVLDELMSKIDFKEARQ